MPAKKSKTASQETLDADPNTGEIITPPAFSLALPKRGEITPLDKAVGKNPTAVNLRDHPEFSGMDLYVVRAHFTEGDYQGRKSYFVVAGCFITAPGKEPTEENQIVLVTGSDNVYARIAAAVEANALPIVGTLRRAPSGRAWFLD